jgi:hypothetical protein
VPQGGPRTQYAELRWGEPSDLVPAARQGSLCSRALLRARGVEWERPGPLTGLDSSP